MSCLSSNKAPQPKAFDLSGISHVLADCAVVDLMSLIRSRVRKSKV